MYLGLDLGTSSLKALLVGEDERVVAAVSIPLEVQRPRPGWSEQDPEAWWAATLAAIDALADKHPREIKAVRGIGLSGQMHGAVLVNIAGKVLRPCILWNDGRAEAECKELEERVPEIGAIAGNRAMPGFTAPKLIWVRRHEPDLFARTAMVLLPKAWLRWRLTGEAVEEMSDASGTLWLDVGARAWSETLLHATGLSLASMPRLVEGSAPAGLLREELAARWKMDVPPVFAGGAGDNAAGAIGVGAVSPGSGFISLGTSGVVWATTDGFQPYTPAAVHAFCHALPGRWHQMGVTLSAAASLAWWAQIAGRSEAELLAELPPTIAEPSEAVFLPYLSGERTPHNDGALRGLFAGLSPATDRAQMTQAILEGVAYSIADCVDALAASGTRFVTADAIGGGARSPTWVGILSAVLGISLNRVAEAEHGAALGAARLARLAVTGEAPEAVCATPKRIATVLPDAALVQMYQGRRAAFRRLYPAARAITA
jgi:xylulokinase